tara:strand:+ start:112 stop:333 length:222 start_codon:yes stop_codon:yes gene_type:complete
MIIDTDDLTHDQIKNSCASSQEYMRVSLDGSKTLIKTEDSLNSCYQELTKYSHSEILTILSTDEWVSHEDPTA